MPASRRRRWCSASLTRWANTTTKGATSVSAPTTAPASLGRLAGAPPAELAGMPLAASDDIDGRRWRLDAGWVAARFSGTEPLLRIYCEADTAASVTRLLDATQAHLGV